MLTIIQKAEKLVGYLKIQSRQSDTVIDNVLDKLFDRERQRLLIQQDEWRNELTQFEEQYQLSSADFYQKFARGEMGDEIDFVDWAAAWRVYQTILRSLNFVSLEIISS